MRAQVDGRDLNQDETREPTQEMRARIPEWMKARAEAFRAVFVPAPPEPEDVIDPDYDEVSP